MGFTMCECQFKGFCHIVFGASKKIIYFLFYNRIKESLCVPSDDDDDNISIG